MKTRKEQMTTGALDSYANFIGDDSEYKDWFAAPIGQSRDSDCLERSNFEVGLVRLGGESETVRVERYGHWAVGWIEQVYVKPNSEAYKIAEAMEQDLADYPVLCEEDFSEKEMSEANDIWANYYDWRERIAYIREHLDQFEFHGFSDMIESVRGKYFAGYASELIQ